MDQRAESSAVITRSEPRGGKVRILHTSDWQLGMTRKFLGSEEQGRFGEARLAAVEKIFDLAEEHFCDAIVVAGDVFDDNLLDSKTWRRAVDVLKRAPVPTYLLPGNHDPLDASSIFSKSEFTALNRANGGNIEVLRDSAPRELRHGVEIVGAPLLSKKPAEDVVARALEGLQPQERGNVRVLVGHGNTRQWGGGDAMDFAAIDVERAEEACRRRIVDYVALGDTHSALQLGHEGRVWYSGSPEVTDFLEPHGGGENNSGKALVVDIEPASGDADEASRVGVEEVSVGEWKFLAVEAEVNTRDDVEHFVAELKSIPRPRNTVVKYALRGTLSLETSAALEKELEELAHSFAALYRRESKTDFRTVPDDEELAEFFQGAGFVTDVARELGERAHHDNVASDAIKLLYRITMSGED